MKHKTLNLSLIFAVMMTLFLIIPPSTEAAEFYDRFTVVLDGNEPTYTPQFCNAGGPANYEVISLTPSVSGWYYYGDLSIFNGLDIQIDAYVHSFDPANPTANFIESFDDDDEIELFAGTTYHFVISGFCGGIQTGRGDFAMTGPSKLGGTDPINGFYGTFTGGEPTYQSNVCGVVNYIVVGPYVAPVGGIYGYADIGVEYAVDIQLEIFEGAFDPNYPTVNFLDAGDDQSSFEFSEGTTYFFVIAPLCGYGGVGIYDFVIVAPVASVGFVNLGLVQINAGSSVQPSYAPAKERIGLSLPADADSNGFDTYVVAAVSSVDGEYWLGLWNGSMELLWVRYSEVIPLTPIRGIE